MTLLASAQPALPLEIEAVTDTAGPCIAPEGSFEKIISKVESYGWTPTKTPNDDLLEDLAWIHAVFYLNSDTGGESLGNILDIQRKAALGFLRKKDIPQSKSRFFQSQSGSSTLMLAWRKPQENVLQVDCRYSLRIDFEGIERVDFPAPFFRYDSKRIGDARFQVSIFDAAQFPDHNPPYSVIHTEYLKVSP